MGLSVEHLPNIHKALGLILSTANGSSKEPKSKGFVRYTNPLGVFSS